MSANTKYQRELIDACEKRATELLQGDSVWGDDDRAELETIMAIGIEAMKLCSPSRLQKAATNVEMRYHLRAHNG